MSAPPDMAVAMAMQNYNMTAQAVDMMDLCWDVCYAKNITRDELVTGAVYEEKATRLRNTCVKRCMGRNFEVMMMQMAAQQERMQQAMAGGGGM